MAPYTIIALIVNMSREIANRTQAFSELKKKKKQHSKNQSFPGAVTLQLTDTQALSITMICSQLTHPCQLPAAE